MTTISHRLVRIAKTGGACSCGTEYAGPDARAQHAAHKSGAPVAPVAAPVAPVQEEAAPVAAWTKLKFECGTCGRCGGDGRMPFAAYGGVCFGCNGHGEVLTAAGRSAKKLWTELTLAASPVVPAEEVPVGAVVGSPKSTIWFTVREVEVGERMVTLRSAKVGHGYSIGSPVTLKPSVAIRREICEEVARRRKGATLV